MHFKNRFVNIFFIFFTYQDALQYDSGTNDFIFTGLPFFTLELYPNMKYDNCNKRNKELKYVEKDERGQKLWVKNWLAPLIKKLMKSLNSGGILAFNLSDFTEFPLLTMLHKKLKNDEEFKSEVTPYSFGLWSKIYYIAHIKSIKDMTENDLNK